MSIKNKKGIRILSMILTIVSIVTLFPQVAMAESIDGTAVSRTAQTVYTGPSTRYVSAGSISANEQVDVIEKEYGVDWYHIQYTVTSTGKKKTGYVPASSLTSFSTSNIYETIFNGGQATSNASQTVWSCDNPSLAVNIGSIGSSEGITLLKKPYSANGTTAAFIEYSTSNGPKRGYLINPNVSFVENTSVARVTSSVYLYSWPSTTDGTISGSVSAGEYVTIIGKEGDWVYVEYNTNNGRKRGYFSYGNVQTHLAQVYNDFYFYNGVIDCWTIGEVKVYAGPSTKYAWIDTLPDDTAHKLYYHWHFYDLNTDTGWIYTRYKSADGKYLTGYIPR